MPRGLLALVFCLSQTAIEFGLKLLVTFKKGTDTFLINGEYEVGVMAGRREVQDKKKLY